MNLNGKLEIVELTDVGMVRDHNEDYLSSDVTNGIAVLADGMGGENAGEVASSMSVHVLMDELSSYAKGGAPLLSAKKPNENLSEESRVVLDAVESANNAVFHVSQTQPQYRGMGTTVVAMMFYDNKMTVAHIGDSRMYRFREDELEQITKDHSFVQELIDKGVYTKEQARASNKKNIVTQALGKAPTLKVAVQELDVLVNDLYLVCSDGLTDLVVDNNIEMILRQFASDLKGMAKQLVEVANASGGNDNISVLLVKVLKPFPEQGGLIDKIVNWFE